MDREKAIRLIAKLLAKAGGTQSPHERASCLETARRLRARHGITDAELGSVSETRVSLMPMACYSPWRGSLLESCGQLYGVKIGKPPRVQEPIVLIGEASLVAKTISTFDRWTRIIDDKARAHLGPDWVEKIHGSWALGFAARLMLDGEVAAQAGSQTPKRRQGPPEPRKPEAKSAEIAEPRPPADAAPERREISEPDPPPPADADAPEMTPQEFIGAQVAAIDRGIAQMGFRSAAGCRISRECPALPPGRTSRIPSPSIPSGYMRRSAFTTFSVSAGW